MKKIIALLTFICVCAATPTMAQFNFGLKAGVNLPERPKLNINDLKTSIEGKTGWYVGPMAKFTIPVIGLGFEANVLYSQSNISVDGQDISNQSIDIPLYLRYELSLPAVNKIIEPFVAIGPQFGWNIGEKSITLKNIANVAESKYNIKESNISLNLGVGITLLEHVQIHGNYNMALGKTADITGSVLDFYKELAEIKTNTWQVSLAYIF
ncbi:MAG: porin family protein [Bacteroidaceae bacterium]|nr:porin family protein [Bacteroidaceae bacterium]